MYTTLFIYLQKYFCGSNLQHWLCVPVWPKIHSSPSLSHEHKKRWKWESLVLLQMGPGTFLFLEVFNVDLGLYTVRIPISESSSFISMDILFSLVVKGLFLFAHMTKSGWQMRSKFFLILVPRRYYTAYDNEILSARDLHS